MADIKVLDVALPLVASIWASGTVHIALYKELNTTRDTIIMGKKDGASLTQEYRELIYKSDWLMLYIAQLFVCIMGIVIPLTIPYLAENHSTKVWVPCWIAASLSILVFFLWVTGGNMDRRLIKKSLGSGKSQGERSSKPDTMKAA